MKKSTLLLPITFLALLCFHQNSFGQAQRLVLVEEFTQASCPPCGQLNPAFNDLLNANPDKLKSLKYQVSWPGFDPMNLQNPSQVATRVSYYGVNGVPWAMVDGASIPNDCGYWLGAPICLNQSEIDDEALVTSPFTMSLSHTLSGGADSIYVTLTITAVASVSGTLKARIAVVEKEIDFTTQPGTNGETVFENVMKQMLPSTTGTALPATVDSGYTTTITASWKLANIYDLNQLAVVAFIQNDGNKTIYQAAYSEPLPPLTDIASATLSGYNPVTCTGSVTPNATITNVGSNTITAGTIFYSAGGPSQTYDWNGSLAPGATSASFQLPAISVPSGSTNLNAGVSINGGTPFNGTGALVSSVNVIHGTAISLGTPVVSPIVQDFGLITFPPAGWYVNNANSSSTWIRTSLAGAYQISPLGSAKFPFFSVGTGDADELYVQNFDFSDVNQQLAYLEFVYAKAKKPSHNDGLNVMVSSDCGANWISLFDKTDNTGLSSFNTAIDWKPTLTSQWKSVALDMTQFIGQPNVLVKFKASSGNGNNLYIDNVNIHYGAPVGLAAPETSTMMVYPNPANEEAVIHVGGMVSPQTRLELVNILGQIIYSTEAKSNSNLTINTSKFETGMYIYRLNDGGKILAQDKLNVSH